MADLIEHNIVHSGATRSDRNARTPAWRHPGATPIRTPPQSTEHTSIEMVHKPSGGPQGKTHLALCSQSFQPVSRFSPAQAEAQPGQIESRKQRSLLPKKRELSPAVASRPLLGDDSFLPYSGMTCIVAVPGTGPGIGTGAGDAP
jgi:hypothetical protein